MKTEQIKFDLDPIGFGRWLLLFCCFLLSSTRGLCADNVQSQKATLEGLDFWIEFPSKQFQAWGSVPGYMHLSNTLDAPHRFSEMKSRYYDTSIGDFLVELPDGTPVESFVTDLERRASSRGSKGLFIEPQRHLSSIGYLDRAFDLTNPGIYKVSALLRIISTNWNGDFPMEWLELRSPPVEIEILPSTNARPVRPPVDIPRQATQPTKTQSATKVPVAPRISENVIQEPAPIASREDTVSPGSRRNWTFSLLVLIPIFLAAFWIIWRHRRSQR